MIRPNTLRVAHPTRCVRLYVGMVRFTVGAFLVMDIRLFSQHNSGDTVPRKLAFRFTAPRSWSPTGDS